MTKVMKTTLSTKAVTELYFYLLQAERSVHKVLGNHWADLKRFNGPERIGNVQAVVEATRDALGQGDTAPPPRLPESQRRFPSLGPGRYFFGRWLARWQKVWSFPSREVRFMIASLETALRVVAADAQPPANALIALRIDLCYSRSLIETRCYGLAILDNGVRIVHLYVSEWLSPVSLADILGQEARNRRRPRKGLLVGRIPARDAGNEQSQRA